MQSFELPIEQGETGFAGKNIVEAALQLALSLLYRGVTIFLEVSISSPDAFADFILRLLMRGGDWNKLVDQSFDVHPAP